MAPNRDAHRLDFSRARQVGLLLIGLLALPAPAPLSAQTAGSDGGLLRQRQKIRTARLGVTRPGGIAYLPGPDLFAVVPARPVSGGPSLVLMTKYSEPAGVVSLPFEITDARAVTFDAGRNRLLALDLASRTLFAVPTDAAGIPDASRTVRLSAPRAGLMSPAGMAVDAATGEVFVLDRLSRRVLRFMPAEGRVPEARWTTLGTPVAADLAALAFDSRDRRFFVIDMRTRRVHELADDGRAIGAFDASEVLLRRPAALVMAPSGDQTDDPATQSLFVSDPGATTVDRGLILEMGWPLTTAAADPARSAAPAAVTATLVRTVATSAWSPSSPDPSGIGYDPNSNRLIVVDGEVEEMTIWANRNAWEASLTGVVQRNMNLTNFTNEPVGVTVNPSNRRVFVADDDVRRIFEINVGPDNLFGTNDDTRTSFSTTAFGCGDPEGAAFDPVGKRLFIASGLDEEIWILGAGTNGVINGGGDDVITHFDTRSRGISDPETVEWDADTGRLLVLGKSPKIVFELSVTGSVVSSTDISFAPLRSPAGLCVAPSSGNTSMKSWYIVNRGTDNDSDPRENDGTLVEIATGTSWGGGGNPPPPPPPPPPPGNDFQVAAGSDDAEESASGSVSENGGDMELVFDGSNQTVGIRFANLPIAKGATISTAWIQFQADETQSEVTSLTIRGQAADNAATFTSANLNVSSRPRTAASVNWTPPAWNAVGEAGSAQRTPELRTVIQEIVNRAGWASGNALAVIITGTGHRTAETYEGTSTGAAVLHVEVGGTPPGNVAPTVSAGNDQTIALPASVSLDGTVNDDGLPSPSNLTTTWSKVSGPGTVTFVNANAVDTQASFSAQGNYVLQLTANDGQLSGSDQVAITVNPAASNTAPVVSAGPDLVVTLPASASLNGTVTDDGLPSPPNLTTTWSKVSGPGTVSFVNANAIDTQASFSAAGSYVLQLSASDGQLSNSDVATITVNSVPNTAPVVSAGPDLIVTLPASASLNGTVTDDDLPSPPTLTTTWSMVSGPGTVTFVNANAVDTQASFSVSGSYVLRLTASDGQLSNNDQATVTVQPAVPPGGSVFEKRIAASSDDAEEKADSTVSLTSSDLELVKDGTDQVVGMRFTGVTVPRNAIITNAYLQFTTNEARAGAISLQVRGQAAGNPPTFTTALTNVSSRPRTTATVAWSPPDWNIIGEAALNQRTPDLKSVIQEIVNRGDWNSGQALVIIVTGTGRRTADCYNGIPAQAPLLHIEYQ